MATPGNTMFAVEREPNPGIIIGPRVKAELERPIHELENRFKPTHSELRELASLKELLKGTAESLRPSGCSGGECR